MKLFKTTSTILCTLVNLLCFGQMQRDQDLVTLKNGYQVLGYVIEQQPGKLIKVYRPEENDTMDVRMEEISKLNKIWVQSFSEMQMGETQEDTIAMGRFNNKKYVFQVTYVLQIKDIEQNERKGVGLTYFRSFKNNYLAGLSVNYFHRQNPHPVYADSRINEADHSFLQYQFLFENKIRLAMRPQNKRFTTLLALNAGYIADFSRSSFGETPEMTDVEFEKSTGGITFQLGLALRVNPDNQSGLIIEPGYSLYAQNVKQFSAQTNSPESVYLGHYRQVNHLFTLKFGYFF